jgi:hypothetical protein
MLSASCGDRTPGGRGTGAAPPRLAPVLLPEECGSLAGVPRRAKFALRCARGRGFSEVLLRDWQECEGRGATSCKTAPPAARDRRALLAALGLTQEGLAVRPHPPCVDLARAPDTIGGLAERQGDGPAPRRDALRPASLAARANSHGRAQRGATKVHPSDGGLSCGERGQLVPVSNTTRVRRPFLLEIGGHPGRPTPLTARLASCGAANGGNKWPPRKAA